MECPDCESTRGKKRLGPLVLPALTKREQVAVLLSAPDDPWWEVRALHAELSPVRERKA
ncbi:hypothetical protein PUR71_09235 [Streptomyces sp. SP17BM10]|uniref:hypothetical protein n=1 Tax=Streptomyces sp. SP17BM10 TaxID=3002530 RepID=UPI002E79640E|nr:hypothetical protein [Streptomyces sp. SP17BM10]MEE1783099.1 hypothetical protein [Streptomyces sp. SP17BM10]